MVQITTKAFYSLASEGVPGPWFEVPDGGFDPQPLSFVDDTIVSTGPWWFDGNHAAPGAGWLQLVACAYLSSWVGAKTEATIGPVQPLELRNSTLSFDIKTTDFELPAGAKLVFWFQSRDMTIPESEGQMVNYAMKEAIVSESGTSDWRHVTIRISDDDQDWIPLGSNPTREDTYSISDSVSVALSGQMADAGFVVLLGNPDTLQHASGQVAFRNITWSYTDHSYLHETQLNLGAEALGLELDLGVGANETLAAATLNLSVGSGEGELSFRPFKDVSQIGSDLFVGTVKVATIDQVGPGELSLVLSEDATGPLLQSLLEAAAWQNASDAIPGELSLNVHLVLADGTSSDFTQVLEVASQDDASAITGATAASWTEDAGPVLVAADIAVADPDGAQDFVARVSVTQPVPGDVLAVGAPGTFQQSFDPENGILTISGHGTAADLEAVLRSVTFNAGDNPTFYDTTDHRRVVVEILDRSGALNSNSFEVTIGINAVDDPATMHAGTASVLQGESVALAASGLFYRDPEVRPEDVIYTLAAEPQHGQLLLDGVAAPSSFTQADVDAGRIVYVHDDSATTQDQFDFGVTVAGTVIGDLAVQLQVTPAVHGTEGDDELIAAINGGALVARGGNDLLVGGAGDDQFYGGGGIDTVSFAQAQAAVGADLSTGLATGAGQDSLNGIENLVGSAFDDQLTGDDGSNLLDGGAGSDRLAGGTGDDVYVVDSAGDLVLEDVGQGADEIRTSLAGYSLASVPNVEMLTFTGNGDAVLTGNTLDNSITGGTGNDILDGGAGGDTMAGLGGNDWYFVDNAADRIVENPGEGIDRVLSRVSYTLGAGLSVEILTTAANAGTSPINLTGNELANTIYGNAGANVLDGKASADTMVGLAGDDWYFVDNASDRVVENPGEGNDRISASVSYRLGAGVSVELLTTDFNPGTAAIDLTGNELANTIYGNDGANVLDGKGGADLLLGLDGDDWYFVDNVGDRVFENPGEGTDRILASVSYTLGAGVSVESLTTDFNAGTAAINLTGNELANIIYGNAGNNVLDGKAGADTLLGLGGDDWYLVDDSGDRIVERVGEGNDRILSSVSYTLAADSAVEQLTTDFNAGTAAIDLTGNELANIIYGNAGANLLHGGGGDDVLFGLGGDDQLFGDAGDDLLDGGQGRDSLSGGAGQDIFQFTAQPVAENLTRILDFTAGQDRIALDSRVFDGLNPGELPADAFRAGTAASAASDRIIYDQASGQLFFDADGAGGRDAAHFADLAPGLALTAQDFFVI